MPKPKKARSPLARRMKEPLWRGPQKDGITFSLLSRFLVCRERFRLLVVDGLTPEDQFNHRIEYGQLWHTAEEAYAAGVQWEAAVCHYASNLCQRYPLSRDDVLKWQDICLMQFPIYLQYWRNHKDVSTRRPLIQEQPFAVSYRLPSGRTVVLRGKWDSVDLIGSGKAQAIYLQENKTKGDINELQIKRQLTFDLQTMIYLVALWGYQKIADNGANSLKWSDGHYPIAGVRYNVVRRPLSGGKGSIIQKKGTEARKCSACKGTGFTGKNPKPCDKCERGWVPATPGESREEYIARLEAYIKDEPETYFFRWRVEVGPHDVERFRRECLDPILEQLCDWWAWVKDGHDPYRQPDRAALVYSEDAEPTGIHWRHPFGVYNVLDEGGSSDVDEYLASGSEVGLRRTTNLFPELT